MTQLSTAMAGSSMAEAGVLETSLLGAPTAHVSVPRPRRQARARSSALAEPRPALLPRPSATSGTRLVMDLVACIPIAVAVSVQVGISPLLGLAAAIGWTLVLATTGHYRRRTLGETRTAGLIRVLRVGVTTLLLAAASNTPLLTGGESHVVALSWLAVAFTTTTLLVTLLPVRERTRMVLAGHPRDVREALVELLAVDRDDVVAVCLTRRSSAPFGDIPTYVGMAQACEAVTTQRAQALIVLPGRHASPVTLRRLQWDAARVGAEVYLGTGLLDVEPQRTHVVSTAGLDILHVTHPTLNGPRRLVKDVAERAAALLVLLLAFPVLAVLCMLIRLETRGPALFRQQRIGLNGVPFTMLKLRSMALGSEVEQSGLALDNEKDGVLFKIQLDPRVTPLGRRLRRYSLDELPQLWNVVRGDMSLVGPRPALPDRGRPVRHRSASPARGQARRDRPVAGLWSVGPELGGIGPAGPEVRRQLVAAPRRVDRRAHRAGSPHAPWCVLTHPH